VQRWVGCQVLERVRLCALVRPVRPLPSLLNPAPALLHARAPLVHRWHWHRVAAPVVWLVQDLGENRMAASYLDALALRWCPVPWTPATERSIPCEQAWYRFWPAERSWHSAVHARDANRAPWRCARLTTPQTPASIPRERGFRNSTHPIHDLFTSYSYTDAAQSSQDESLAMAWQLNSGGK
jgi:hypothetical protein